MDCPCSNVTVLVMTLSLFAHFSSMVLAGTWNMVARPHLSNTEHTKGIVRQILALRQAAASGKLQAQELDNLER